MKILTNSHYWLRAKKRTKFVILYVYFGRDILSLTLREEYRQKGFFLSKQGDTRLRGSVREETAKGSEKCILNWIRSINRLIIIMTSRVGE